MVRVRTLIIGDSDVTPGLIEAALRPDPEIELLGVVGDLADARDAIEAMHPDVLTVWIDGPRRTSLNPVERILKGAPLPVVAVTAQSRESDIARQSLASGAYDCICLVPVSVERRHGLSRLAQIVKAAARGNPKRGAGASADELESNKHLIALGGSAGGVEALAAVLSAFPRSCPPTVIVQHIPANFVGRLANHMNQISAPRVCEASDGASLDTGTVYIAPGDRHLEVCGSSRGWWCRLKDVEPLNGFKPSIDVLFFSVARSVGARAVGALLSGMGRDGVAGLLKMRQAGARTFGQGESSCAVYGMSKAAFEAGAVEKEVHLDRMAPAILSICGSRIMETR